MRCIKPRVELVAKYLAYASHLRKHPCDHKGAEQYACAQWGGWIDEALTFLAIKEVVAMKEAAPNN